MTSRFTGSLKEGDYAHCDNCQDCKTVQFDGQIPSGWFVIEDSKGTKVLFCSTDCIAKKLSAKDANYGAVEKVDFWSSRLAKRI